MKTRMEVTVVRAQTRRRMRENPMKKIQRDHARRRKMAMMTRRRKAKKIARRRKRSRKR